MYIHKTGLAEGELNPGQIIESRSNSALLLKAFFERWNDEFDLDFHITEPHTDMFTIKFRFCHTMGFVFTADFCFGYNWYQFEDILWAFLYLMKTIAKTWEREWFTNAFFIYYVDALMREKIDKIEVISEEETIHD